MSTYQLKQARFRTFDGEELFYRCWLPEGKVNRAILLFHRGHEHSGRFSEFAEKLDMPDCALFAWDARGNGQSPGRRDYAESFSVYAKDADCFARHIQEVYGIRIDNMAVVANSVGAVIASSWVHDYAPPIRALVLAAPAFRIKLYVPLAIPMLRLGLALGLVKEVKSYVKSSVLTHDVQEQAKIDHDELITHGISTNILLDVHDTSTRLIADAGAVRTPVMMLAAGNDWVVKNGPQRRFFERLSSPIKEWHDCPGAYHAVYHEEQRDDYIQKTRDFLQRMFCSEHVNPSIVNADKHGYTKLEYDELQRPRFRPVLSVTKLLMKSVGRLSTGIQTGWSHGFDSGVMLDHVYTNRASGVTVLGKVIDRSYLNSLGWRGIRRRKINMENSLQQAVTELRDKSQAVNIVDIASGPGRYILETLKQMGDDVNHALLRDYKDVNTLSAKTLVEELGLDNVSVEEGDAFDSASLATLEPAPTIAVVSGLYELIPDNALVRRSLAGLAESVPRGGYLIYTNQPYHPQVEFIARVLTNREGQPWVMRRRTQEEMDALVREAGFEKVNMEIDQWGIFTVSMAKRV